MKDKYLITVTTLDGDHESRSYGIVEADSQEHADEQAAATIRHDDSGMDTVDSYWSYRDGMTRTELYSVLHISKAEASSLHTLGIAHDITLEEVK